METTLAAARERPDAEGQTYRQLISGCLGPPAVVRAIQAFCDIAGNPGVVTAVGAPEAEDVEHTGIVGKALSPPLPGESRGAPTKRPYPRPSGSHGALRLDSP